MKKNGNVLIALALVLGAGMVGGLSAATDPATIWNREELYKVPKSWKNQDPFRGEVTPMWLEGEPYRGKPTRLFTFLGLPEGASPSNKVPGIVLVHGGLGTAYPEWVRLWTRRGYAAITVDNCGQLPAMGADGKWMANPDGGPRGWGEEAVKHLDEPLREQWMYHAIAASVRAHSYLRSLDCVDTANVGVTGISWGGFQTCILAALDERFAYAVPVYGCGFNDEPGGIMSAERYGARGPAWSKLWDPVRFLPYVKVPLLWVDGTNDHAFSLDRVMRSADLARGESQFCTRLRMVHAHGAPGEAPAEILAFADHYARGAKDIVRVTSAKLEGDEMVVKFNANGRRLARAELLWTCDGEGTPYPERNWKARQLADFAPGRGCVRVRLEKGTAQALVNFIADDGLIFSSRTLKTPLVAKAAQEPSHEGDRASFGPLTPSARPCERQHLWPEGKMPDAQSGQVAARWADVNAPNFDRAANRRPYIEWYAPAESNRKDLCVLTVSGGGFRMTCDAERLQPAIDRLVAAGITVADVTYRTPRPEGLPIHQSAWEDVQRAVRIVRSEAAKRGYSPEKIGATGISAGAKAVLLLATSSQTRAYGPVDAIDDVPAHLNFAVVQAPAYVLSDGAAGVNVRGGDGADITILPELRFDAKTCPMCFLHGGADTISPLGSTRLFRRLREMGIPAELHVFAGRWHGFHGDQNIGEEGEAYDHWWDRAMEFILPPAKGDAFPAGIPEGLVLCEANDPQAVKAVERWEEMRRRGIQTNLHVAGSRGPTTWRGRIREWRNRPAAAVGTSGAATLSGETSNPHNSCFALGSAARARFEAKGFPPGSEQRLDVRFFDDEDREVAGDAVSRAVRIGADGTWRGEVALPTKTLGFRRVRATLGGATLPAVGSRPKGCLTYLVAPDPKSRRLLSEKDHFLGIHGELAGETALMPWIGARWQLRGLGPYATDEEYRKARAAADRRGWTYFGFYSPQVSHLKFERSQWAPADRAWAEKHGDDQWNYFTTPEGREVYRHVIQDKVRASLRQPFYTKARMWETMWEPELSAKPEVLVEAVRYSTALIKEIDPDAKIAIPTVSGLKKMDYYRQIFERGILDSADVFDMHFYSSGMPPEENGYVRQVRELVKMVRKYAGRKIPMIATEGGYNTKATREEEFKQMTGIVRMLLVLLGEGFDFALPFYGSDYGGDYADRAEGDWGVTYNLELPKHRFGPRHVSPRPVLAALSGFGLMVDGSRPTACLECLGEKALGYAFQDAAGEVTLALWCWGETPAEVELPVGVACVRVGDIFGNLTERPTEDGVFRTTLSAKPIYVKGASAALWGRDAVHALKVERTSMSAVAGARVTLCGTVDRAGTLEVRPAASLGLSRFARELTAGAFSVELELPAQARDGDYPVTLVFREGRKIVSLSGVRIAVDAPVKIRSVRPTAAGEDPALAVTLENMTDAAKAGVVTLRVGEEPLARRSQAVELAPGAVRTFEIACPGWRPDPFATLEAVVAFDTPGAMRTEMRRPVDFLTASHAPGVGKSVALEDWTGIKWRTLPQRVTRKPEFTRDGNDLSAKLALGWNEDFFLVAVEVVDDDPVPPERGAWWLWRGDAVQVAFAKDVLAKPSENAWADALDQAMTENAIGLAPEGPQVVRTVSYDPTRFPCDINGDAAVIRDAPVSVTKRNRPEGGVVWSYRAAFPWKYMNKTSAEAGETVYFAAAVNDLDRDQKDLSGLSVFELKKQAPRGFGAVCLEK